VADVGKLGLDTWHLVDKWYGAMWPRHGLPRGTLMLSFGLKINVESVGVEPQTSI
jgi:hypothetical protein